MTGHTHGTVIVGGGLAAVRTTEQLRRNGYAAPITIVGAETHLPYDRPPLSKGLLRGEVDDVALKPAGFYEQNRIALRLGAAARSVDAQAHTLTLADGAVLRYDRLVIATGLVPSRIPSFPDLDGIHLLRSLDDGRALRRRAVAARRAVVVGAGFIGCEVAASLRGMGVEVVLVEPQDAPLASVLGERVGTLLTRLHRGEGVDLRTGATVAGVAGVDRVESVTLSDGSARLDEGEAKLEPPHEPDGSARLDEGEAKLEPPHEPDGAVLEADLVVVGIGSRPASDWLTGSDVAVANGVVCDAVGRTSAVDVWAIGDVASWRDAAGAQVRVEHWSNVAEQAKTLVAAMLGLDAAPAAGVPYFWSDQYDVKIQCLGHPAIADTVHLAEDDGRRFAAYYERDGVLVAMVGAGAAERVRSARGKIAAGASITEVLQPA